MITKKKQLVIVEWEDAWSTDGWMSEEGAQEEAKNRATVTTVGFIIKRDNDGLALAQGIALHRGSIGYSGIFVIPDGMIKKISKVRY